MILLRIAGRTTQGKAYFGKALSNLLSVKVIMFANANAMTTVGRRSLEALRLQPLGKPPQCFS